MFRTLFTLGFLAVASPVFAGLETLFETTSRDFGMVPHGSVQIHRFVLNNTTDQVIRVSSFASSCKCATPKVDVKSAGPGESLFVDVEYNTRTFTGPRSMTITVTFDRPRYESVSLRVSGYSRQDVVVNPSQIAFGVISKGNGSEGEIKVEYAGPMDFRIQEVLPAEGIEASVEELYREPRKVGYRLNVKLPKTLAPGEIFTVVQLKTNDPKSPILTVPVTGNIEATLSAAPDKIELGQLKMGQSLTKKIIVKSKQPFTLEKVTGDVEGVLVKSTEGERTAHIIEIEYSPTKVGAIAQEILLKTTLEDEDPLAVHLTGSVVEK